MEILKIRLLNKSFANDIQLLRYCLQSCLELNLSVKEVNKLYIFKKKQNEHSNNK